MRQWVVRGAFAALMATCLVVIAGAASPSGHARGISYSTLNPIQKRLVSGALAQTLGPATVSKSSPTANAATAAHCVNPTGGGDESDEADNECAPDSYGPPTGSGGGG